MADIKNYLHQVYDQVTVGHDHDHSKEQGTGATTDSALETGSGIGEHKAETTDAGIGHGSESATAAGLEPRGADTTGTGIGERSDPTTGTGAGHETEAAAIGSGLGSHGVGTTDIAARPADSATTDRSLEPNREAPTSPEAGTHSKNLAAGAAAGTAAAGTAAAASHHGHRDEPLASQNEPNTVASPAPVSGHSAPTESTSMPHRDKPVANPEASSHNNNIAAAAAAGTAAAGTTAAASERRVRDEDLGPRNEEIPEHHHEHHHKEQKEKEHHHKDKTTKPETEAQREYKPALLQPEGEAATGSRRKSSKTPQPPAASRSPNLPTKETLMRP
jgi:hypothetical protein